MLSAIKTKYPRLILHTGKLKSTCEYYYIANWFTKDNSFQKGKHETIQNFTPRQLAGFPYHGCYSQGFLKLPHFFLTSVKFPWPTELTISHIRPDDGLNRPLATISSTYLFMLSASAVYIRVFSCIWKYRRQRFSWQTHAAGEMLSARVKNF